MTEVWTTAYLAALADPDDTLPFVPQPRAFSAQTIRQAVRLRRGGTSIRLVLSNEFGAGPLVIDEVTVSDDASVNVLPVLFRGGARWDNPLGGYRGERPGPAGHRRRG